MGFFETPTGYNGKRVWLKIHEAVEGIECDHCRTEGRKIINFAHDMVNAKLRKPLHDAKNFEKIRKNLCKIRICRGYKLCRGI